MEEETRPWIIAKVGASSCWAVGCGMHTFLGFRNRIQPVFSVSRTWSHICTFGFWNPDPGFPKCDPDLNLTPDPKPWMDECVLRFNFV